MSDSIPSVEPSSTPAPAGSQSPPASPLQNSEFTIQNSTSSISQNASNPITEKRDLTPIQHRAILLLMAGTSDAAVAYELNLHRTTITKWRLHHPLFREELRLRRQELYSVEIDRLRCLIFEALKETRRQLRCKGDRSTRWRTAKALINLIGAPHLAPQLENLPPGPIPEALRREILDASSA